jgi:PAS domain S-box-containing protein
MPPQFRHAHPPRLARYGLRKRGGSSHIIYLPGGPKVENRDLASPALKSSVIALDQPAVIQWNTDGLVMAWNPAAEHLLGLPAGDAVGKNISELFASAGSFIDEQSRLRLFTECRAVDSISHTATKAGKHAFVSWSHAPVTGEGGNAICAVSTGRPRPAS